MKNSRKNSGFSLAEMLIVVAIIIVLAAVSFVGVQRHQRSMTRLEFDTIAKEIFIAAQNHLTAAEGQGYLQEEKYGNAGNFKDDKNDDAKDGVFYVLNKDSNSDEALKIMLPDYAIDGAIASGTYIIRYQPSTATVLDVFYSRKTRSTALTVSGIDLGTGDYEGLMKLVKENADSRQQRLTYNNGVVGYYGGGEPVDRGERLAVPTFEIENAERLIVRVTDPNSELKFASLKLIITGEKSREEKQKVIPLVKDGTPQTGVANTRVTSNDKNTLYTIVLDDITTDGMHFSELNTSATDGLIPGEDINVKVIAYSNTKLTNIAISPEKTTNSLFADPIQKAPSAGENYTGSDLTNKIAGIANIRHLENLEADVSSVSTSLNIEKAKQITDLSWTDFRTKIGNTPTKIYYKSGDSFTGTEDNCFYPVSPEASLEYDGQNHSIIDVKVNFADNAGLFGTLVADSAVMNLELIDFNVTASSGNAGALAGSATSTTITNVLAHHTNKTDYKTATVTATAGNAGGLVGYMNGGTVSKSAAALVVSGSTNAGGLIGISSSGTVTACYSGGHTYSGAPSGSPAKYSDGHTAVYPVRYYYVDETANEKNKPLYNVTASGTAGGLIGNAGSTAISYSYSTCSAKATDETSGVAGGLVGKGGTISKSYCTGLVSAKTEGAFAGSGAIISSNDCKYFEIINERRNKDDKGNLTSGYNYLKALGDKEETDTSVGKIDATADDYKTFVGVPAVDWKAAKPYDNTLIDFYGMGSGDSRTGRYNFKTVGQLAGGSTVAATDFVSAHYGDWPAPEEFIFVSN